MHNISHNVLIDAIRVNNKIYFRLYCVYGEKRSPHTKYEEKRKTKTKTQKELTRVHNVSHNILIDAVVVLHIICLFIYGVYGEKKSPYIKYVRSFGIDV